jgi:hypothetical protein
MKRPACKPRQTSDEPDGLAHERLSVVGTLGVQRTCRLRLLRSKKRGRARRRIDERLREQALAADDMHEKPLDRVREEEAKHFYRR